MHQPEAGRLSRLDSHMVSSLPIPIADGGKAPTHAAPSSTETSPESPCKGAGGPRSPLGCHGAISAPIPGPPSKWHIVRNVLRTCDLGQRVVWVPICLRYITGPLRKRNLSLLENSRRANWPFPLRAIIREAQPNSTRKPISTPFVLPLQQCLTCPAPLK